MTQPNTYHTSDVARDDPAVDRPPPPGGPEDYVLTAEALVRLGIRGADDPADLSDLPGLFDFDECDGEGAHPSDCPCVECRMAGEIRRLTEEARPKQQRALPPRQPPLAGKLQDHQAYPPRAMRAERAAAYLDMSTSTFFRLVGEGLLPPPIKIRGMVTWDRLDLDAAYENLKSGESENTVHKLLSKEE